MLVVLVRLVLVLLALLWLVQRLPGKAVSLSMELQHVRWVVLAMHSPCVE